MAGFRRAGHISESWSLHGIPNVEFYRKLNPFLKKWERTHLTTKTSVGRFYITVHRQLQDRGSTPINTYLFIEKVVSSERADADLMSYGITTQLQAVQQVHEDETNDQDYDSLEI